MFRFLIFAAVILAVFPLVYRFLKKRFFLLKQELNEDNESAEIYAMKQQKKSISRRLNYKGKFNEEKIKEINKLKEELEK